MTLRVGVLVGNLSTHHEHELGAHLSLLGGQLMRAVGERLGRHRRAARRKSLCLDDDHLLAHRVALDVGIEREPRRGDTARRENLGDVTSRIRPAATPGRWSVATAR